MSHLQVVFVRPSLSTKTHGVTAVASLRKTICKILPTPCSMVAPVDEDDGDALFVTVSRDGADFQPHAIREGMERLLLMYTCCCGSDRGNAGDAGKAVEAGWRPHDWAWEDMMHAQHLCKYPSVQSLIGYKGCQKRFCVKFRA